jgi:hypothetical protein
MVNETEHQSGGTEIGFVTTVLEPTNTIDARVCGTANIRMLLTLLFNCTGFPQKIGYCWQFRDPGWNIVVAKPIYAVPLRSSQ